MKPPKALEQIVDVVLAYRPKSKQPKPRKRKKARRAAKPACLISTVAPAGLPWGFIAHGPRRQLLAWTS